MRTTEKKKKWYVKCEVNMCAEKVLCVIVQATKESIAKELAVAEVCRAGYFHAKPIYCEEVKHGRKNV